MPTFSRLAHLGLFCVMISVNTTTFAADQASEWLLARVAGADSPSVSQEVHGPDFPRMQTGRSFDIDPASSSILRLIGPHQSLVAAIKRSALSAYDGGNNNDASRLLSIAFLFDSSDLDLLRRLGFALKSIGHYEEAHDALAAALRRDPGDFNAWWWMSDTQRLLGDYDAAIESMRKSVDCAPIERRSELGDYVTYSTNLASTERSWRNSDIHVEFAGRHENNRRSRRVVLEYMLALERTPEVQEADKDGQARLGWINSRLGFTYAYLKEYLSAVVYFDRAASYFDSSEKPADAAQNRGALADALELYSEAAAYWRDGVLDEAVSQREESLKQAEAGGDIEQTRYALGRLLGTLSLRFPEGNARLDEVRERAAKELPRRGPINEYSVAAVALGEATCRMAEKDYAGARIVIEMLLPYLDESLFLEDTERHARLLSWLAFIYNGQGHHEKADEYGRNALQIVDRVRSFVTGDVYARTTAAASLRIALSERIRSALPRDKADDAYALIEEGHARSLIASLGSKIAGETHSADATAELAMIEQRIPQFESFAAHWRDMGRAGPAAWLDATVAHDRRRLEWLKRGPVFVPSTRLRFKEAAAPTLAELQEVLVPGTAYLSYHVGDSASSAVLVSKDAAKGFSLDGAGTADLAALIATARAAFASGSLDNTALDELGSRLLAPVRELAPGTRLYLAPDGPLYGLPFEALRLDGAHLLERCSVTYTASAGYLILALSRQEGNGGEVLDCCSGSPCDKSALFERDAAWTHASVCAGTEIWLPNATDSAILFPEGAAPGACLYFGELLGCRLPLAGISLCLSGAWATEGIQGAELQALLVGLAAAGATHAIVNLWQSPCGALMPSENSCAAFLAWKRALAADRPGDPAWVRDVVYVF